MTAVERNWADFVVHGAANQPDRAHVDWTDPPPEIVAHQQAFVMGEDETLAEILAAYAEVAAGRWAERARRGRTGVVCLRTRHAACSGTRPDSGSAARLR